MDASRPGTDPLTRYAEGHRLKIRAQARRLAEVMAAALPPDQRGPGGAQRWEDVFYEAILEQCAWRGVVFERTPDLPDGAPTRPGDVVDRLRPEEE